MIQILPKNENDIIYKDEKNKIYIYESNPCVCPVLMYDYKYDYNVREDVSDTRVFDISLPYVQCYVCHNFMGYSDFRELNVLFTTSKKSIKSPEDEIYKLPLPNINVQSGVACLYGGYEIDVDKKSKESYEKYGARLFTSFFTSRFNKELGSRRGWALSTWEKKTKKDPEFIMQAKLPTFKDRKSFQDIVSYITKKSEK